MMTVAAPVVLRPMTIADIPVVLELERATYPQPWSEGIFTDELSRSDRVYVLAEQDRQMIGFAGLMLVEDDAHVTTLAVKTDARKAGLGTRLMLRLIAAGLERGARNLTLEVRATNEGAQRLYNRFGMAAVGVRKNYYRDDDAVIMWATDIDQPEYAARLDEIRSGLGEQS
jgi:[ribosomal protein S18]-alanine N-acetyltransferase